MIVLLGALDALNSNDGSFFPLLIGLSFAYTFFSKEIILILLLFHTVLTNRFLSQQAVIYQFDHLSFFSLLNVIVG